jgi:hypothetical protein
MTNEIKYKVEFLGDFEIEKLFDSLGEALEYIAIQTENEEEIGTCHYCDPEDNRILIHEILPTGHSKVVWHFSGWHWDQNEFGEQGKLLEHDKSLYDESMEDY